jgi:hypothetical protein
MQMWVLWGPLLWVLIGADSGHESHTKRRTHPTVLLSEQQSLLPMHEPWLLLPRRQRLTLHVHLQSKFDKIELTSRGSVHTGLSNNLKDGGSYSVYTRIWLFLTHSGCRDKALLVTRSNTDVESHQHYYTRAYTYYVLAEVRR